MVMQTSRLPLRLGLTLGLCALVGATGVARGDCGADYREAMSMIGSVKEKTLKQGQKIDKEAFQSDFATVVNRMAQNGCISEVMQIYQFVQREQQQYPAPATQ